MLSRRLRVAMVVPAAFGLAVLPGSSAVAATGSFTAEATGANEVAGGRDDASASGSFTADSDSGEFCYTITAEGLDDAAAMHIHVGEEGVDGDVVIELDVAQIGQGEACTEAESDLLEDIIADPAGYYLNVHTPDFPAGAVRGQLSGGDDAANGEDGETPTSVGAGTGGLLDEDGVPLVPVLLVVTGAAVVGAAGWRLARR
jgi:CHRD domain